jgi:hypothetical protein
VVARIGHAAAVGDDVPGLPQLQLRRQLLELLTEWPVGIPVFMCWLSLVVRKGQQPPRVVPDG